MPKSLIATSPQKKTYGKQAQERFLHMCLHNTSVGMVKIWTLMTLNKGGEQQETLIKY